MATKLVADISKHDGTFNAKVMAAKVDAVLIRAGYRKHDTGKLETDEKFKFNIESALKQGMKVGVYWWTQAKSNAEAIAEAQYCVNLVKCYNLSFPIWLDLEFYDDEHNGRADHLTAANRTEYAVTFVEQCKKLGYSTGVYCNPDFWKNNLVSSKIDKYPRWIANYVKAVPMECDMWQYTSTADGATYGVSSKHIDLSHMYTDFTAGCKSKFEPVVAQPTPKPVETKPTETKLNTEVKWNGFVTAETLNARVWAGVDSKTVSFSPLKQNAKVGVCDTVKAANGDDWYYVKYKDKYCFVSAKYISKEVVSIGMITINCDSLNIRSGAGTSHPVKYEAKKGQTYQVKAVKTVSGSRWYQLTDGNYCSAHSQYTTFKDKNGKIDYLQRVSDFAPIVYDKIVEIGCKHKSGATTFEEIVSKKITTCNMSVCAVLQKAGLLQSGKKIGHTTKDGKSGSTKTTIEKALTGLSNLKSGSYTVAKTNCVYDKLDAKYKKSGVVYVQDSNLCLCAGGGYIYSTNEGTIQYKNGKYVKTKVDSGYPFTSKILYCIVPKTI